MADYNLLLVKIQTDHVNDAPDQIVSALNAKTIASKHPISRRDIKKYLILNSLWLAIKGSTNPVAIVTIDAMNLFDAISFLLRISAGLELVVISPRTSNSRTR